MTVSPAMIAAGAGLGLGALAILIAERRRPRRSSFVPDRRRLPANITLGAMSMAAMALTETPASRAAARMVERGRIGIAQRLPGPAWLRDAAGFVLMDYTTYLWHVLTHKVPFLWRFHLVHHVDQELDASTALRFHAVDMVVSTPFRVAQVLVSGAGPRALELWRAWFMLAVLFHHSNLRLGDRWERQLSRLITTPGMHEIHHTAVRDRTDSNWSSGLAWWDHLHRTFRLDFRAAEIGVPAYRDPAETGAAPSLRQPFAPQRDAWSDTAGRSGR